MTTLVDEETLQRIREELAPLVDEYLAAHPEIVEQHAEAFAAAAPAPAVEAGTEIDDEDDDDFDLSIFDELEAEEEQIEEGFLEEAIEEAVNEVFDIWDEDDLGLGGLFGEDGEEDE